MNNLLRLIFFVFLISSSVLRAQDIKAGKFGEDGYPVNCGDAMYSKDDKPICFIAKKENITISSYMAAVYVFQTLKTINKCEFILKKEHKDGLEQIQNMFPTAYKIAEKYGSLSTVDCKISEYYFQDILE